MKPVTDISIQAFSVMSSQRILFYYFYDLLSLSREFLPGSVTTINVLPASYYSLFLNSLDSPKITLINLRNQNFRQPSLYPLIKGWMDIFFYYSVTHSFIHSFNRL